MKTVISALATIALSQGGRYAVDFDNLPPGAMPPNWVVAETNGKGHTAHWSVAADAHAKSGKRVLQVRTDRNAVDETFNLCWVAKLGFRPISTGEMQSTLMYLGQFTDGEIQVHLRADSGEMDQGGGITWRVKDHDNYYLTRYNPLEKNLRLYFVKDGSRRTIASVESLKVGSHAWFTLGVSQHGDLIKVSLNGKKLIEKRDRTFRKAGGVGLWSKSDASSSFDDFVVKAQ
ncbi:MAG: hypothetical protein HYR64_04210 [Fimbriimonas ginsengisoli]|uniref:3-keto-disaccharide hydrolase domain-containing protein n=1 Tax=Fimbriimonas ginsengisoli TaxID=1005039 RepID=A0A931LUA0_FIMGI|nr:hypothetical protein [Fimbriimonas ginsengisoli]